MNVRKTRERKPDADASETSVPAIIAAAESRMKVEIPRD